MAHQILPEQAAMVLGDAERTEDAVVAQLSRGVLRARHEHDLATLVAAFHDNCVVDMSRWSGWPDQWVYRGSHGLRHFLTAWHFVSGDLDARPVRLAALDLGRYFLEIEFRGQGNHTGIELTPRFFRIAEHRDGLLAGFADFTDEREALEAAGLAR
jgi:SnoaL-like domain